ncbi:hypothetical protein ACFPM0_11645 [Pseudonocardia sulfidoxydans]|uniref:hypothetical protein n=1 Tax=Pseudonocardia sulfidoxydans TaxID=54011 RepID=UPI0036110B04
MATPGLFLRPHGGVRQLPARPALSRRGYVGRARAGTDRSGRSGWAVPDRGGWPVSPPCRPYRRALAGPSQRVAQLRPGRSPAHGSSRPTPNAEFVGRQRRRARTQPTLTTILPNAPRFRCS